MLRSLGTLATTARALRRARPRDVVVVAVPSRSSLRLGARRATSGVPSVPRPSPHSAHAPHPSTVVSGGAAAAPEGPPDWASRAANWMLEHPGALAGTLVLVLIGWITHGKLDMDARKKAIESIDASQPIAPEEFRQITESNRLTVAEFLDLVEVAKAAFPDGVAFADEFLAIMARGIARERHPRGLRGLHHIERWVLSQSGGVWTTEAKDAAPAPSISSTVTGFFPDLAGARDPAVMVGSSEGKEGVERDGSEPVFEAASLHREFPVLQLLTLLITAVDVGPDQRMDLLLALHTNPHPALAGPVSEAAVLEGPAAVLPAGYDERKWESEERRKKHEERAAKEAKERVEKAEKEAKERAEKEAKDAKETGVIVGGAGAGAGGSDSSGSTGTTTTPPSSVLLSPPVIPHAALISLVDHLRAAQQMPSRQRVHQTTKYPVPAWEVMTEEQHVTEAAGVLGIRPVKRTATGSVSEPGATSAASSSATSSATSAASSSASSSATSAASSWEGVYSREDALRMLWSDKICAWGECPALVRADYD